MVRPVVNDRWRRWSPSWRAMCTNDSAFFRLPDIARASPRPALHTHRSHAPVCRIRSAALAPTALLLPAVVHSSSFSAGASPTARTVFIGTRAMKWLDTDPRYRYLRKGMPSRQLLRRIHAAAINLSTGR